MFGWCKKLSNILHILTIGSPTPQVFEAIAAVALVVDCGVKLSANQFFKGALDQKSEISVLSLAWHTVSQKFDFLANPFQIDFVNDR